MVHTDFDGAEGDHLAVDFIDGSVDFLHIVRVGDDLVAGEDILEGSRIVSALFIFQVGVGGFFLGVCGSGVASQNGCSGGVIGGWILILTLKMIMIAVLIWWRVD